MRGECANSVDLVNWISDLHSAGVRIPEQIEKLVRPDSSLRSASQVAKSLPSESQAANSLPSCAQSAQASVAPNHPAPSAASESSHGLFRPSNLFGPSLNRDHSSGFAEPSLRVSFSLPPLVSEEESDVASVVGDSFQPWQGLSRVCRLLFHLCPDVVPTLVTSAPRSCQFEGLFSDIAKPSKETFSPVLFHCVLELLSDFRNKFASTVNSGKTPVSSLPFKKRPLASSSDPDFGRASVSNPSLSRIVGSLAGSRSAGLQLHEVARMEAIARQLFESQSVSLWLFSALLNWLKQEAFAPSDAVLFEEPVQVFSLSVVTFMSSLATLCQAKRREAVLSHFPAHISSHFRSSLVSSFTGPYLFDEEALLRVLAASREDSAVSANVALVKAVSFPVFGAGKSDRKASFDQSSAISRGRGRGSISDRFRKASALSSSAAASRVRGRGSISDRFREASASSSSASSSQDRKRKAASPADLASKSPHCSSKNPGGKSFRK